MLAAVGRTQVSKRPPGAEVVRRLLAMGPVRSCSVWRPMAVGRVGERGLAEAWSSRAPGRAVRASSAACRKVLSVGCGSGLRRSAAFRDGAGRS